MPDGRSPRSAAPARVALLGNGPVTRRRYWGIDWIPDASTPADRYGRLSSAVTPAPGGGVLQSLAYGYDDGGNVTLLQDARANEQVAYGYGEGLVRNLPSNEQFAGPFWGVGGYAGIGVLGADVGATFGFPVDRSGNPVTTIVQGGWAVGAGALVYAGVSASLEVAHDSGAGRTWLPAIQQLRERLELAV